MDIVKLDPAKAAEDGYSFFAELPDGTITDLEITVRGELSEPIVAYNRKKFKEYQKREALAKKTGREAEQSLEDLEKTAVEMAVIRTKGWSGMTQGKEVIEFSEDTARQIYTQHSWLRAQVLKEAENPQNFKSQ